jgi:hypothetical protein
MKLRRLLLTLLVSCSGDSETTDPTLCAGSACPDGMYCSAAEACVPDDGCLVDDDCTTANCSNNQTCIAPGTCAAAGDCEVGSSCNLATSSCEVGGCGGEILDLTYVAPNFMVVLDRSCSMDKPLQNARTKWEVAVEALHTLLGDHPNDLRWGLTLFPDTAGDTCGQGALPFAVADGQAAAIDTMLQGALDEANPLFPAGPCVTNIDTAIQQAATDPGLADATRGRFVMLITDGAQAGCNLGGGDAGTLQAITELEAAGVTTYVVGFGSGVDEVQLNAFAVAGGAPRPGATKFFRAENANQLATVFQAITGAVASCEYVVDPAPPDLALTYVYFEATELVPRDTAHAEGWDYDPATLKLTLYGTACARIQDRTVDDVDVVFGCPVPPVQ